MAGKFDKEGVEFLRPVPLHVACECKNLEVIKILMLDTRIDCVSLCRRIR